MNKIILSQNTYRCRLCLKVSTKVINIFREDFAKMIKLLTNIQVQKTDDLPKVACISCTMKVKTAMIVRKQIIRSHRTLLEESLAKRNTTWMLNFNTKAISDNSIKEEPKFVAPEIIILDVKNDLEMEQEVVPSDKLENEKNIQNFPASLNTNEISIVQINKPNHEGTKIARSPTLLNNTTAHVRRGRKRQSLNFALIKTNIQSPRRKNPIVSQPAKRSKSIPLQPKINRLTPVPCKVCQKSILYTNMKQHLETHDNRMVTCHLCGKVTKNTTLRAHIFYFHKCKEDEYVCDQCGRHFRYRNKFNLHMKKSHGGTKDFECTTCGMRFFEKTCLTKHINMKHMKLRPHICEYCGKGFSGRHALRTHVRQHTNEAPYQCNFCGERFRQRVSLKGHLKTRHKIQEENTVFCETCGKGFASIVALDVHSRLHKEIKCSWCSNTFAEKEYLEQHISTEHPNANEDDET